MNETNEIENVATENILTLNDEDEEDEGDTRYDMPL